MLTVIIPGPALPERKRQVRRGNFTRRVDCPDRADYKAYVKSRIADVLAGRPPLTGPLALYVTVTRLKPKSWPKKRSHPDTRPDCSNYVKLLEDCGNKLLWEDDALICHLVVTKRFGPAESVTLTVFAWENQEVPHP